jgi:3-hydroxyisobutyrate dehydrogenase
VSAAVAKKNIAVIGLGLMGVGIARNYLKHGYAVYVWNRSKDKVEALVNAGALATDSPKEAVSKADIVFEVTATDESSKSVWQGESGILAGSKKGVVLISSGTFSVAWTDELAKLCFDKGFTYFDIPLTGGRPAAENGQLILLVGGDESKLDLLRPDLEAISSKIIYFGKAGSGARYKLALNALQAMHRVGLSETLKLAQKSGLDLKRVGDALAEYPGGVVTARAWNFYQNPPSETNFAIKWIAKDLDYAREMAAGLKLSMLDDALETYARAQEGGLGDGDWSEVMRL